jgi:hypothetical protein
MSKILQVWKVNNYGKGVIDGSQDFFRITPDPSTNGGGAEWGGITGTLSAQTDLQTALDAKTLPLIADDTTSVVTGVTVPTAFRSYLIPAGTLTNYNRLIMQMQVRKESGTGTGSMRFYVNTSNDFATSTQIATANMTSGISYGSLERKMVMRSTNLIGFGFTTNSATDSNVNAATFDTTAFNRANDIWVFVAVNPASVTEVYTLEYFEMNARRTKTTI